MMRLKQIEQATAEGKSKELLEMVSTKLGRVPNILKCMANSPAALECYLQMTGSLSGASLSPMEQEAIALLVGQKNECEYCVSAHTVIGGTKGMTPQQAMQFRKGKCDDAKMQAMLNFTTEMMDKKGKVSSSTFEAVRKAGYNDAQITEMTTCVALNMYTNFFNLMNETELDFPKAECATSCS